MIEKMSFVTLTGPRENIDNLIENYLCKYDIHLENALLELDSPEEFGAFSEDNPYSDSLLLCHDLVNLVKSPGKVQVNNIDIAEAERLVRQIQDEISGLQQSIASLEEKKTSLQSAYETLFPFKSLNYSVEAIENMNFFEHRFGKLPKPQYEKFVSFIDPDINAVFVKCYSDADYVYGVFLAPTKEFSKIRHDFKSIRFEDILLPEGYVGFPSEECDKLSNQISAISNEINETNEKIDTVIEARKQKLVSACRKIELSYGNFDVKKLSACTKQGGVTLQVLCGWMATVDANQLNQEIASDSNIDCLINDNVMSHKTIPPTKLKNWKLLKPFELFVKMYGLPSYQEMDPTLLLTITYAFIFGVMFGDIGQGLCLFIGGFILYKVKKMDLAGIICAAGFFSIIFGALFGSFFGYEFESVINPLHDKMTLPFLGEINIVLVAAFLFGSFVILMTMIINISIAIKQRNLGKALFGPNAITGFIFYGSVILTILLYMTGQPLPGTALMVLMFCVPLILIFFEKPLKNLITRKKPLIDESPGIFGATAFFEVFDYLISYMSNALSFLRIGVFAISHAAMMQVVMTLAGAENGGDANILVVIIGNIIVLAMEGLVVGIQVLRLEYYEIFGRFYEGSGREFVPYNKKVKH